MKVLPRIFCLLVAVAGVIIVYQNLSQFVPLDDTASPTSSEHATERSAPAIAVGKPVDINRNPKALQGKASVPLVIASAWIDPEGKPSRRRVQIVRTDFKYSLQRRVEEVLLDRDTGEERIRLVHASVADHVLVGLKAGVNEAEVRKKTRQQGFVVSGGEPGSFLLVEVGDPERINAQEASIRGLSELEEFIDFSEPDYLVWPSALPNDPEFAAGRLWGLNNPGIVSGTSFDADIDAPEGWDIRSDASNVIVAVTDTGIRYTHEDLASNMWTNAGETPGDGIDNDQNGVVDDIYGFDAQNDDGNPADDNGHGTHVAGTIGAQGNNGIGVAGVAWDVRLMALKFISDAGGTTSDAIRVINYARLNGARIINASWGGGGYSQGLFNSIDACGQAGILFVAAAGNDGADNDASPHYPSSYQLSNIVTVASTTQVDELSDFSNTGQFSVDLAAPGSNILSTFHRSDTDYSALNGTSMATPQVSGALALAVVEFPGEDAIDLRTRLLSSVDTLDSLRGEVASGGRLNLHRLLTASSKVPVHDQFDTALRFEGSYGFWAGNNRQATREPDEDTFSKPGTGSRSLWFAWKAPRAGLAEFEVTAEAEQMTTILYRGREKGSLNLIDEGQVLVSADKRFFVYVEAGEEYHLVADSSTVAGQNLTVSVDLIAGNDNLSGADELGNGSFSVVGNNRKASTERFEQTRPHGGVGQGHSVWWKWTPASDGDFVITTEGSLFDTVLAVYTGDPTNPAGFSEVIFNDDRTGFDWTSEVTFGALAGVTYYIAVDSYRSDSWGDLSLNGYAAGQLVFLRDLDPVVQARPGERQVVEVSVAGENVSFNWFKDGVAIPFERSSRLVFDQVVGEDAGIYHVVAQRGSEEIRSRDTQFVVADSPPEIVWKSPDQAAAIGADITLRVAAIGSGTLSYQWYHEGSAILNATSASLTIVNLEQSDAGVYSVVIENSHGSVESPEIQVKAQERPWGAWTWERPRPFSGDFEAMEFLNGNFVGLSTGGISNSFDGANWRHSPIPDIDYVAISAAYGNGVYVFGTELAFGGEPKGMRIVSSTDLATFSEPTMLTGLGTSGAVPEIEYGAGVFVARTQSRLFVSSDGIDWFDSGVVPIGTFEDLAFGAGRFLAKTTGTTSHSSLDGMNWTEHPEAPNGQGVLEYLDGEFHFWGSDYYTSADGVTWSEPADSNHGDLKNGTGHARILLIDGMFANVRGGSTINVSTDGSNWNPRALGVGLYNLRALAASDDRVVVAGRPGSLGYGSSLEDLILEPNPDENLNAVAKLLDGEFVLTNGTGAVEFSAQGDEWESHPSQVAVSGGFEATSLTYAFGKYWALRPTYVVGDPSRMFVGDSPMTMEFRLLGPSVPLTELASGGGKMIGIGSDNVIYVTSDGITWVATSGAVTCRDPILHYIKGQFIVFCGVNVHMSTDGVNWRTLDPANLASGSFGTYQGACEALGKICIFSNDGDVAVTADGINWETSTVTMESANSFSDRTVRAAGNDDSLLVVFGPGKMLFTNDLQNWVEERTPSPSMDSVLYGNGTYLLTGGRVTSVAHGTIRDPLPRLRMADPLSESVFLKNSVPIDLNLSVVDPAGSLSHINVYDNGTLIEANTQDFDLNLSEFDAGYHSLVFEVVSTSGAITRTRGSFELKETSFSKLVSLPRQIKVVKRINGVMVAGDSHGTLWSEKADGGWLARSIPVTAPIVNVFEGQGVIFVTTSTSTYRSADFANFELVAPRITEMVESEFGLVGLIAGAAHISSDGRSWEQTLAGETIAAGNGILASQCRNRLSDRFELACRSEDGFAYRSPITEPPGPVVFLRDRFLSGGVGRIASSQDADDWQVDFEFEPFSVGRFLLSQIAGFQYFGGRYFASVRPTSTSRRWTAFTSVDGVDWVSIPEPMSGSVTYGKNTWWIWTAEGIRRSVDGLSWPVVVKAEDIVSNGTPTFFYGDGAGVTVIQTNGDMGVVDEASGRIVPSGQIGGDTGAVFDTSRIKFLGGSELGYLIQGEQSLRFTRDFSELQTIENGPDNLVALSADANRFAVVAQNGYWESLDGITWTEETPLEPGANNRVFGMCLHGDKVVVHTTRSDVDNVFVRTGDGPWISSRITDFTPQTNDIVTAMNRFEGEIWAITDRSTLLKSSDGLTWSMVADGVNFLPVGKIGDTYIGKNPRRGANQYGISEDLVTWASVYGPQGFSNYLLDLVVHDGIAYLSSEEGDVWTSPNAEDWSRTIVTDDELVLVVAGDELIAYSQSHIWGLCLDRDFFSELNVVNPLAIYGAGDVLELDLVRVNRGDEFLPGSAGIPVEVVLSGDGLLGGDDDVDLGSMIVDFGDLLPGESESLNLQFTLPENLIAGSFHVFAKARKSCVFGVGDRSLLFRTEEAAVLIPDWELSMVVFGDGLVETDLAQRRFPHKTQVSLTATAGKGASFAGWGGDAVGGLSQVTILMTGDQTVEATFVPANSLQLQVRGAGSIVGGAESGTYPPGSTVELTAVPAPGWEFLGWEGASTESNPTVNVTMNGNEALTAKFILPIEAWREQHFSVSELADPLVSGDGADPDRDGILNAYEYLHGSDPRDAADKEVVLTGVHDGWLTMIYTRLQGVSAGYGITLQGSWDITNWDAAGLEERILRIDDGTETVEARLPVHGHLMGFLRLGYLIQ